VSVYRLAFEGATPLLDSLGEDLTARARRGGAQAAAKRSDVLRTIVEILNERAGTPNVPLLIGEPGVGKSAMIEELARQITSRDTSTTEVPDWLCRRRVLSLLASALAAGDTPSQQAQRVEALAREMEVNREGILLFIDEAHELMAQFSDGPQSIAVQQLKAGLARGLYPLILATTPDEQARIERDPAFIRRLVTVPLKELTCDETIRVLNDVWVPRLLEHHHLTHIGDDALDAAVDGLDWYQPDATRPAGPIRILARAASRAELDNRTAIDAREVWAALSAILDRTVSPPSLDDQEALDRFVTLDGLLRNRIRGQEHAFDELRPMLLGYLLRRPDPRRKPLVLLFVGPPGVGKTDRQS
jgi:ATP-dependent Clp protease ATP-binding subunit ClpC